MDLQTNKTLGGIGALLLVIDLPLSFFAPVISGVLGLVGLILLLIAMKGMSDHYNDGSIFNNSLYGVIISIIGVVVFVAALLMIAVSFFRDIIGIDLATALTDPTAFSEIQWMEVITIDAIINGITALIGSLVILFIFAIVAAIFYRKSLTSLGERTGVGLFGTAGLILLIGAVLTIILIGFVLIWVALLLVTIAFFQVRTEPTQAPS